MLHVGVDVHKHFSQVEVLDERGETLDRRRLAHPDKGSIRAYFEELPSPMTITMESTRNWYWLYELLEEFGEVQLANPSKVRLIAEAKIKTDQVDARTLAHLERTGFLPTAYIPPREVRNRRELYRYRISLVTIRTGLRNRIHALLDKLGIFHSNSDLFGLRGRQFLASLELRDHYQKVLDGYLQLHDGVDELEKAVRREIKKTIGQDPRANHLMTIPGIGIRNAYLLLAEIGDIDRFPSAKKLLSYASLVPRTRQSADHLWQGTVGRKGNLYIKWAMVEAAQKATRKDPGLAVFYERIRRKHGAAKARVAVAAKLLKAVYYVLKRDEDYKFNSLATMHMGKPGKVLGRQRQTVS
jgi:transposase